MSELITLQQASEILGCTPQHVRSYVRKGLLRPQYNEGKSLREPQYFLEQEVSALLESKSMGEDLPTVAAMARQAFIASRTLERTMNQALQLLGANIPRLLHGKESILALYVKAEDALPTVEQPSAKEVLEWAKVFYAMSEEYLMLVEDHTGNEEPWGPFLELGEKLYNEAPAGTVDKELETAYGYLAASLRNMRNVAYFYVRHRAGKVRASEVFPMVTGDVHDEVIAMAFPD